MRRVLSLVVWLFSFWTWNDFFLRWRRIPVSHASGGETAEHLPSQEGQPESELARFLSSLPEDERRWAFLKFNGDSEVRIRFGLGSECTLLHGTGVGASYGEFLEAVASSEIVFCEKVLIRLNGEDSCKHVEAFADALRQSGHGFRKLDFRCWGGCTVQFARCVASLLLGNDAIEDLSLNFQDIFLFKAVDADFGGIIVGSHNFQTLKSFHMWLPKLGGEVIEQLLEPFQGPSSTLEILRLDGLTSDAQFEHIGGMLASSTSLKTLSLNVISIGDKKAFTTGYTHIATTLCSNQSLEALTCRISSYLELKTLLNPLMPKTNNLQCNSTLTKIELLGSIVGKEGIQALVDMICSNTSLLELGLIYMEDLSFQNIEGLENVLAILEALKTNKSLKRINLQGCEVVGGYKVLGAMMDLLLENHCIEKINMYDTGLEKTRDTDYVYSELSKRRKVKLWGTIQGMANVKPTSGRVFLCGNPYAGKTTMRMSMKKLKEFQEKDGSSNRSRFRDKVNFVKRAFKPSNASKVLTKDIQLERTHGIEVDCVQCDGIAITIWDMAGQADYHSFHELVMPNLSADGSCSLFLLMCNPMEQSNLSQGRRLSSIKVELEYWLRFIASNTRRSLSFRPHVSIVMTHIDHWKDDYAFATCIDDVVLELKPQFKEVLEFDEGKFVFKVDGRNEPHARGVFDFIKLHLKQLLERLPKTLSACEEVQCLVASWNADQSKPPLLKWDEFCEGMCKEVEELNDVDEELAKRRKEFVAISLNDGGHIIYYEKERVVITNPHWFCHNIMGQFLHQCTNEGYRLGMVSSNGIISIDYVRCLILKLLEGQEDIEKQFDAILGMMIKLHICYKQDAHNIMIPSTLKNKVNELSWSKHDEATSFTYVGRRLACKDKTKTMLTPGFFTRLQVSFFQLLQSKNAQDTYEVFQDVFQFINEGIEAILQFNDGDIDILLRSHQSQDNVIEFLENQILMHIKHRQGDPTLGCPGVLLVDCILRPMCVEKLVHPKDRKNQIVHMKDLEVEVIKNGIDHIHYWKSCEGLGRGSNKVKTLLGGLAWKKLLERRSHHLQEYDKEIQSLDTLIQNDPSKCNEKNSLSTTSLWQMPQKLLCGPLEDKIDHLIRENRKQHKETQSKLDNVVHLIERLEHGIKNMQGKLLLKVCSRIDDLMAFSVEMQKSHIPKLAYLCESGKRRLLTKWVPDLNKIQLHLMCESRHGFHEVANQKGCVVNFGTENTKRFLAMLVWGLKIVTILTKIGAHVACGMGPMVPDFSDGVSFTALILDTSGFLDYQIPTTTLESLPDDLRNQSRISIDNASKLEAQRWLREYLEPQCKRTREFYDRFQLKKVKYKGVSGSIAWICDECISRHPNEVDELT